MRDLQYVYSTKVHSSYKVTMECEQLRGYRKGWFTMHATQLSGTVPCISRTCGGAVPPAAPPIGSSPIFAAWRSAAEVTLGLRTWILPIGKYYKILQNHVSVSIWESHHGALVYREQTQAARCRRHGSCYSVVPRRSAVPRASH